MTGRPLSTNRMDCSEFLHQVPLCLPPSSRVPLCSALFESRCVGLAHSDQVCLLFTQKLDTTHSMAVIHSLNWTNLIQYRIFCAARKLSRIKKGFIFKLLHTWMYIIPVQNIVLFLTGYPSDNNCLQTWEPDFELKFF